MFSDLKWTSIDSWLTKGGKLDNINFIETVSSYACFKVTENDGMSTCKHTNSISCC